MENVAAQIPAVDDDSEAPVAPEGEEPALFSDPDVAPDPLADKVFGEITAKDLIDKIKAGEGKVPDELLDLEHEYVFGEGDDAEKERMTLREALDLGHKERMQLRVFHRELHQVRQLEQQVVARGRALEAAVKGLNDPKTLFEDLQSLNVSEETLMQAARHYAQQRLDYKSMSPSQRAMIDAQREQRQQVLKMQRELEELRSERSQLQQQQFKSTATTALRTHMAPAFKAQGLNAESAYAKAKFQFFLERAADGKTPTRDMIYEAAKATKQDIAFEEREDRLAKSRASGARQPVGKPLGPRSAAAPAALKVPAQANGRRRGFTASEFGNT
jgi:hypothetical protein